MNQDKILIKNAIIIDGSDSGSYPGNILIIDDTIALITKNNEVTNPQAFDAHVIEAGGRIVTPGFIDLHRHCDYAVFKQGFGEIELAQGITTAITGSCGLTPYPSSSKYGDGLNKLLSPCLGAKPPGIDFSDYDYYDKALNNVALPINIGEQIGSCALRIAVKGFDRSPFTEYELNLAREYILTAMQSGVFGLSLGIMYIPEFYSTQYELAELAKTISYYNGVLTCHIRGEGNSLVSSVLEVLEIAAKAGVKLEISHFKACGADNWNKSIYRATELIEGAQRKGQDIGVDFYPYDGGATTLLSLLPPAYMKESLATTLEYMATPTGSDELRRCLGNDYGNWDNYVKSLGWDRLILSSAKSDEFQPHIGQSISKIAAFRNTGDEYDNLRDILIAERGMSGVIVMSMDASDIDYISQLSYSCCISDSLYSEGEGGHPRLYGAFPKLIRDFVIQRNRLSLSRAINKMTSKPAQVMGIKGRGLIKEGYKADICVFNPKNIVDHAGYGNPKLIATGMDYVLVNGKIAYCDGKMAVGASSRSGCRLKRI